MPFKKRYQKPYEQPPSSPIEISFWETAKPLIPELEKEVWIDKKYRVDFLIPSKKVIVELYGYQYHNTKDKITKDAERERYLQRVGYQVIRFTGTEVFKDVRKCVYEVLSLAKIQPASIPVKPSQPVVPPVISQPVNVSTRPSQVATGKDKITLPAVNKMPVRSKKKIFGIEIWQIMVLSVMALMIACASLCFISMYIKK